MKIMNTFIAYKVIGDTIITNGYLLDTIKLHSNWVVDVH